MKQKQFAKRLGRCFVPILCLTFIINLLWPDAKQSTIENRSLQQFPTCSWQNIWDGRYQTAITTWFSDQFVGRYIWIHGRYLFLKATQNQKINDVFLAKDQLIQDCPKPQWSQIRQNIQAINTLSKSMNIPTSFLLVPTALSIQNDRVDKGAISYDQNAIIQTIDKKIDKSIQIVDVRKQLKNHAQEYIYYKTDHHWTSLGAFYAFQAFYPESKKSDYKQMLVSDSFHGTLSHTTGSVGIKDSIHIFVPKDQPDYLVTNEDDGTQSRTWYHSKAIASNDQYAVFGNGNHALVRIEMDTDATGHLLLIKDSYANALIPFLIPYYKSITVVDPRYYYGDLHQLIQQDQIDSMMYVYNVNTFIEDDSLADCLQ
ncbi:MAG: DHHW family protein [Absicoccus sp.]|uniref:DHHW family protein n=1 Tax=Absicoccus sp. TaxID=2718527 RepID=UPI002A755074|nr:DHHW family protein [Absicoccus sp.]MDY3035417.1 DHHW family protein [Absicoccus sp.]